MSDLSGRKSVAKVVSGPSSYATGGFDVEVGDLRTVEYAFSEASGGYVTSINSITGNTVKIGVYSGGSEVASGTDLSGVTFRILAFSL